MDSDSLIASSVIMSYFTQKFPGGLRAFNKEGGEYFVVQFSNEIIISHPNLTEAFKTKMLDHFKASLYHIEFDSVLNVTEENAETVNEEIGKLREFLTSLGRSDVEISPDPVCFMLTFQGESTSLAAKKLKTYIEKELSLHRVYIMCNDTIVRIIKEAPKKLTLEEVSPERMSLNDDDILNVKIALENALDVNDFIKNL
jgi:hypothetical protein